MARAVRSVLIHKPGTPCLVGCDWSIRATILAAKIGQNNSVVYEVAWASSSGYTDVWMLPCEIKVKQESTQKIGFINA